MKLKETQQIVEKFVKDKALNGDINVRMLDLTSEVGELSKEILKGTNYGTESFKKTNEWESEIGDVLFSLICIANESNTDLEYCLNYALNKYEKRFSTKGNLSSGK